MFLKSKFNMVETPSNFDYLEDFSTISLKTFYKSGKGVATPVDFIKVDETTLYVNTPINSYKVKRLKQNSKAIIAPCTMSGKILGPEITVVGKVLSKGEDTEAHDAFKEKWDRNLLYRVYLFLGKLAFWKPQPERVIIELKLLSASPVNPPL
jgi:PPOX class probable F420-dependent enzyme